MITHDICSIDILLKKQININKTQADKTSYVPGTWEGMDDFKGRQRLLPPWF